MDTGLIVATLLGVLASAVGVLAEFRNSSKQEEKRSEARLKDDVTAESVDDLSGLLVQNFRVLNTYYSENLSQSRTSARASISIAVLGFVAIVAGAMIGLVFKQSLLGSLSALSGVICQAASVLFFRQQTAFQAQMKDSLKKLVSTQYLMTSIALARELPESFKIDEVHRINRHLRELMSWLHSGDVIGSPESAQDSDSDTMRSSAGEQKPAPEAA